MDESNVLQYRTYFGQSNNSKIGFISDERAAKIGWINTFASGGMRSGFNNECLYGDCNWDMQVAKSASNGRAVAQYIIRHRKFEKKHQKVAFEKSLKTCNRWFFFRVEVSQFLQHFKRSSLRSFGSAQAQEYRLLPLLSLPGIDLFFWG